MARVGRSAGRISAQWLLLLTLLLAYPATAEDETSPEEAETPAEKAEQPTAAEPATGTAAGNTLPPRTVPDLPVSREHRLQYHLGLFQRDREPIELTAAEETFQGLLLTERSGTPQGGVLILHDQGQHGHWPDSVAPLREYLPDYGWTTLSIGLPDVPPPSGRQVSPASNRPPETPDAPATGTSAEDSTTATAADTAAVAAEATDSNGISLTSGSQPAEESQPDNEPALPRLTGLPPLPADKTDSAAPAVQSATAAEHYREQMLERIGAGIQHLNNAGQLNLVIIAHGHSAAWAVAWLNERQPAQNEKGLTLVLVDALDNTYAPVLLDDALEPLEIPVLDLITPFNRNNPFINQQRAGRMKHKQRKDYQQIELPGLSLREDYGNTVTRRVRGWLKTNAAGTELKTARN